jgi:CMP-N-acetylneuraminic acid synthetase
MLFARNGAAIYIIKYSHVKNFLFGGKIINFLMNNKSSIDIDTVEDIKLAEKILKRKK